MTQNADWSHQKDQLKWLKKIEVLYHVLPTWPWWVGGEHQVQPHGQWFNQWHLHNKIPIKPLETEAQVSCIDWQDFMHILPRLGARRVMRPWGHRSFTCVGLPIPDSALWISSLGWFWFVSFSYSKTIIICIAFPWILCHSSDLPKLMVVLENPQICSWCLKSWAGFVVRKDCVLTLESGWLWVAYYIQPSKWNDAFLKLRKTIWFFFEAAGNGNWKLIVFRMCKYKCHSLNLVHILYMLSLLFYFGKCKKTF